MSTLDWTRRNVALVLLAVLVMIGAVFVEQFRSVDNLLLILKSQSFVGFVALGMTFVVIAGQFVDLSVPATIAVTANAALAWQTLDPTLAIATALTVAAFIGVLNGVVIAYLKVNPVIGTLAIGSIAAGLLLATTGGALSRSSDRSYGAFVDQTVAGVPVLALLLIVLALVFEWVLHWTAFGLALRLVGGNARMARGVGLRPAGITVAVFVIVAVTAGTTGCMLGLFAGQADVALGAGYEFDALIAVVLGGTALTGGTGSFVRTLVGVVLIGVLNNLLLLGQVSTSGQYLVKGIVFTAVVAFGSLLARRLG